MRVLLDERSRPPLRTVIGALLGSAREADIAVGHIRLGALDMQSDELTHVRRCRILVGRLDAHSLSMAPGSGSGAHVADRFRALVSFLESDAVEVRSAGVGAWTPDFSIYRGLGPDGGGMTAVCLVGAHYFHEPHENGPSFTWASDDRAAVQRAARRFDELWLRAYDVRAAVLQSIEQYAAAAL